MACATDTTLDRSEDLAISKFMTPLDFRTQQVANSIMDVIELAYTQGRAVTFRTIFSFLQFPPEAWQDDPDLDEPIVVTCESDLVMIRAMISSMFAVRH